MTLMEDSNIAAIHDKRVTVMPKDSFAARIIAPKKTVSFADGILHQVQKVSADLSELQKNMAVETAARNDLQLCVEKLKADNEEVTKYFAQGVADCRPKDGAGKQSLRLLMEALPCKSLVDLDWLLAYILIRNSHWVCESCKRSKTSFC